MADEMNEKRICPVCGKHWFSDIFEVCPVCGWENDMIQEMEPDLKGGANEMSLNEARIAYSEGRKVI